MITYYDVALQAIMDLFHNRAVSKSETQTDLLNLRDEIDLLIAALQ